ncbi:TRAP-type C4-dicarboxylate transport system, large permease component [uncultured Alphaproteobacteria bacterium]|uniref:TRAP transporter large permease protein n=1 Tax=uncultured Alphaproteobacteria bacterium TaxID=91750 RepID=A0A212KMQ9_9PROT|nr:TRAP-type C4-dicarboxylate transport system, large permease component [uncultured Alphaproteobacteria bacterium]
METFLILSFIGMALIGVPVAYALALSVSAVLYFYMDLPQVLITHNMFSGIDSFSFMAVPFFMLAGAFMSAGGVTKRLVNVAQAMVGSFTGGLAQAVAVAGMFFAAISGSSAATTAAIGSTMVNEMERKGYRRELATGIVAAAGTVGIVIPPSITFVVYGVIANVSIGDLFMGGVLPGILMGLAMCFMGWFIAKKEGIPPEGHFSVIHLLKTIKDAFWAMMTPVIIIGGIYGGIFTPTEAAAVAAVYGIVVGLFVYKELKLVDFPEIVFKAVIGSTLIMFLVGAAKVFGWMMTNLQIPHHVGEAVVALTSSPIVFLMIMNVLLIVLGTLVNASAAVVILTPIFLPVATTLGIDPLHFGVVMVVNLAIGCITPPVGLDLFVASAITKVPLEKVMKATTPYLLALIATLVVITLVPQISLFLPGILQ